MAHTFDTSGYFIGSFNPTSTDYTCGAGTTLLVVSIQTTLVIRSTGAPTYGGKPLTMRVVTADLGDTTFEVWSLQNPSTGAAYTVSISNTGLIAMQIRVSSYKAASGFTSTFDASYYSAGAGSAPQNTAFDVSAGGLAFQHAYANYLLLPTFYSHSPILPVDHGTYTSWEQYFLPSVSTNVTMSTTIGGVANWAAFAMRFRETVRYYGTLKRYDGASWVDVSTGKLKRYAPSAFSAVPLGKLKMWDGAAWVPIKYNS